MLEFSKLLPQYHNNAKSILDQTYKYFCNKYNYKILVAAEIEFFITETPNFTDEEFYKELLIKTINFQIKLESFSAEVGVNQYEVSLQPYDNPVLLAEAILLLRNIIINVAKIFDNKVDFSSVSEHHDATNGMHIHINLFDNNNNLFLAKKISEYEHRDTDILLYAINGLLELTIESLPIFAPLENDYRRFIIRNKKSLINSPSTICWGGNNRTALLRIPDHTINPESKRIEHRLPSNNANPYLVIAALICAIDYGLEKKVEPIKRIYGNSYDMQYNLEKLPNSLENVYNKINTKHLRIFFNKILEVANDK